MKWICTSRSQKRDVTIKYLDGFLDSRYTLNYDIDRDSMRYVNNQIFCFRIMTSIETLCDMCKQSNLLLSNYDIDQDSMRYVNNQIFYYQIMTSIETLCDM